MFASADEFQKAEYDFQEKVPLTEKIGSHCVIATYKHTLSFKTKEEQINADLDATVKNIQQRFPFTNYVGVPVAKEVAATKQIGEIHLFRTIPLITSNLSFYNFNTILTRA